jgi:hypothetical protein
VPFSEHPILTRLECALQAQTRAQHGIRSFVAAGSTDRGLDNVACRKTQGQCQVSFGIGGRMLRPFLETLAPLTSAGAGSSISSFFLPQLSCDVLGDSMRHACLLVAALMCTAVLLGLCAASAAQNAAEPYHIKNDVLGESITAYRQNNPECGEKDSLTGQPTFYHVKDSAKWSGSCMTMSQSAVITYATRQMKTKDATFSEDRFVHLMYVAHHSDYGSLRDNLIAKFGEPSTKTTQDVQNRMGAHFQGEVLLWDNGVSSILLQEYAGDLDSSSLVFALDEYLKEQEEIHKKSLKKASPDM